MPEAASSSSALHQRQRDLEVRLRLLEAEAVDLEARRGQAVLAGGEALAQLHQRVAEVEVEQADVAAGIAALEAPLARAREREQQERQQALRDAATALCQQRLQAAGAVDRALQLLAREVGRWQGLAGRLQPIQHQLAMGEDLTIATGTLVDAESLRRAFWAAAPAVATLLGLEPEGSGSQPLAATDGAGRVATRLQQRAA